MPELERFELLFERGHPVQRLSVLSNLPMLVDCHGASACSPLLTMITKDVPTTVRLASLPDNPEEMDVAVAAAQALVELLSAFPPLPVPLLARQLLPTAMSALEEAPLVPIEENATGAEWLHFVLALLRTSRLSASTLSQSVLPWALRLGEVSSPCGHRLMCTHVLGALSAAHPEGADWISSSGLLAHALSMCQDTELHVRCSMCVQLPILAAALGLQQASDGPLSEALELTCDECAASSCSLEPRNLLPRSLSNLLRPPRPTQVLTTLPPRSRQSLH